MPSTSVSPRDAVDPRLVDGVLAVAMTLAVALVIAAGESGDPRPAAYLFAVGFGVLVALRRHWPRAVLVVTVLGIFAYYALGFPVIGIALPAVAALYSAAELGRTVWAIGAGVVLIGVSAYFQVTEEQPVSYLYGYEMITNVTLAAAAVALGVAVRRTREAREYAERVRVLTAAEEEQTAQRRLQAERFRIARDLHDLVGHSLSVIAVHTGVASESVGEDDDATRQALRRIREATSATLRELRATVKVLRTPGTEAPPRAATGLADLDTLVRRAQAAGLQVDVDVAVPDGSVDAAIDAAAYRIVQEALTNVLRHSGARWTELSARLDGDRLRVRVADDGTGTQSAPVGVDASTAPPGSGQGIAGMRERVMLLAGTLEAGDGPDGGFVVSVDLPARLST